MFNLSNNIGMLSDVNFKLIIALTAALQPQG